MGIEREKGPLHPGSHHPTRQTEGSAQHLYLPPPPTGLRLWHSWGQHVKYLEDLPYSPRSVWFFLPFEKAPDV